MTRGSEKDDVDEWFKAWCLWHWHGRKWGRPQPVYVRETPKRERPQETGQP